jgi:hypothetical protein
MIKTENDDAAMMQRPNDWPRWPYLPLIKRGTGDAGFLLEGKPRVFVANIYALSAMTLEQRREIPTQDYDSYDALAIDWRVD